MTDKLALYNGALRKCGAARLAALSDEGEGRRALDECYAERLKLCLESGFWNFATRLVQLTASPSIATGFGYRYGFDKPDDWVKTAAVTLDAHGLEPLLFYEDLTDFWLADMETIYVRYVSNDQDWGMDLGRWPAGFTDFVQADLAWEICERLTSSAAKKDDLEKRRKTALLNALNRDAMNQPVTRFPPPGRLVMSRGASGMREQGRRFR